MGVGASFKTIALSELEKMEITLAKSLQSAVDGASTTVGARGKTRMSLTAPQRESMARSVKSQKSLKSLHQTAHH